MRKPRGIKATPVLVNKVADPIGEDEGKRWRESDSSAGNDMLMETLLWFCRRAGSSLLSSSPSPQMLHTY